MQRSTPIGNLPVPLDTRNENIPDSQLVNEIYKEMNSENSLYQRQMDNEVSYPQENNLQQPTPEQLAQLQQQTYPQQYQQPPQQSFQVDPSYLQQQQPSYSQQQVFQDVKPTSKFDLVLMVKMVSVFVLLFMIVSAPFVNGLLSKVSFFALESGGVNTTGLFAKALVAGFVYYAVYYFL